MTASECQRTNAITQFDRYASNWLLIMWIFGAGLCSSCSQGDSSSDLPELDSTPALPERKVQQEAPGNYKFGFSYAFEEGAPTNSEEAARWYRELANNGNAKAQYNLGVAYYRGDGVSRDTDEAMRWVQKAADQGDADAQYTLGHEYIHEDDTEALHWFQEAADQGHADAQYILGVNYLGGGEMVSENYSEAYVWLTLAAACGNKHGMNVRRLAVNELSSDERVAAHKRAMDLYEEIKSRSTKRQEGKPRP